MALNEPNLTKFKFLSKSDFGQWHLMAYFYKKMIFTKTCYKTHNGDFLTIIGAFMTWKHYLKGYKHAVLVLTDYNNFHQFKNTISISFCHIRWAQELSRYHFRIYYCQDKVNKAANALFRFSQRRHDKKTKL